MTRITADALSVLVLAGVLTTCGLAPAEQQRDPDITPGDMRARIAFLSSDMLKGRDTPSPGLDIAAHYIASEFRRMGLEPPSAAGHIQRYRLARIEMGGGWSLALSRGARRAVLRHGTDFWGVPWAAGTVEGPITFVGSSPDRAVDDRRAAPGVWVAYLEGGTSLRRWLAAATGGAATGVVFVLPTGIESRMDRWYGAGDVLFELSDLERTLPAAIVTEGALESAIRRIGIEPRSPAYTETALRGVEARLSADLRLETLLAPNVMGVLRGRDPELRDEYVLLSAHFDGLGVGAPVDGDSIYNGADDNASGTAAVLEVAEAGAGLEERPRRSLLFLLVSGEEKGLLGSTWFVDHAPVPLSKIVANVNIDMVGRNWEDTISVIGRRFSTLGALIDSVATARRDLGLTVVGDLWPSENFFYRSDHYNFARRGIPAVFVFNGVHEDYHRPSDELDKIKEAKAARIARLVFEVASAVANAPDPPRWDPEARSAIVEGTP